MSITALLTLLLAIAVFAIICVIIVFYYVLLPVLHAIPAG